MNYIATVTSKRQLTIPSKIYKEMGLFEGEKVLVSSEDDYIKIKRFQDLLDKLAGSLKVPKRFRSLSPDEIIKKAKLEHLAK